MKKWMRNGFGKAISVGEEVGEEALDVSICPDSRVTGTWNVNGPEARK